MPNASMTNRLATSAVLVALATVLSWYAVFRLPNGGSVTIGSMIPIMLVSFIYPFGWSLIVALAFSLIQMINLYPPPVATVGNFIIVILLDYVVAFSVLCLSGPMYKIISKKINARVRLMISAIICLALRFACHFVSGIIIWKTYASQGQPVWLYSLLYNGSYMLIEAVISGVVLFIAGQKLIELLLPPQKISNR